MTALSVAGDRFVTALIWGGPFVVGAVVVALFALWAAGLVEMAKTANVVYTVTPTADTQDELEARWTA